MLPAPSPLAYQPSLSPLNLTSQLCIPFLIFNPSDSCPNPGIHCLDLTPQAEYSSRSCAQGVGRSGTDPGVGGVGGKEAGNLDARMWPILPFTVLSLACYVTHPLHCHLPLHRTTIVRTNHVTHLTGSTAPNTFDCLANSQRAFKIRLNYVLQHSLLQLSQTKLSSCSTAAHIWTISHLTPSITSLEYLFYQRRDQNHSSSVDD